MFNDGLHQAANANAISSSGNLPSPRHGQILDALCHLAVPDVRSFSIAIPVSLLCEFVRLARSVDPRANAEARLYADGTLLPQFSQAAAAARMPATASIAATARHSRE